MRQLYTKEAFIQDCLSAFRETGGNTVEIPSAGRVQLFDAPLIGFAAADDELFERYRQPEIIGENYLVPVSWLQSARTVVSFFFPFTGAVRASNRADRTDPSQEWLYGRIEGQMFLTEYTAALGRLLAEKEIASCVPGRDARFGVQFEMQTLDGITDFHADSRWSERHAAYACGLGTFGLSRGLITERGVAGRFASIIVSAAWEADGRGYTGVDDYCIRCGACVRNCPAGAISLEHGKNNVLCNAHLDKMKAKYSPRYGCGKCQVKVPCEAQAPGLCAKQGS